MQKKETNQAFWLVNDHRNSQIANQIFCFSNQAHALDGAIFPWLRDMQAFLLLNQLVNFSKTTNCTRPTGSCNLVSLWKIYSCLLYLFQIALKIMWLPIQTMRVVSLWLLIFSQKNEKITEWIPPSGWPVQACNWLCNYY